MIVSLRIAIVVLLALAPIGVALAEDVPQFQLIVHPSNPTASVDRRFVTEVFLKKRTRWSDDQAIRPVDLSPQSVTRRRFSKDALKRSVEAVRSYWRRIVFSGRGVPPPELDADQDIVSFVRKHRGAIGYVSLGADVSGVKVVRIQ